MRAENGAGDLRLISGRKFDDNDYVELVERVRTVVNASLPQDTTVIVVSKGDAALLELGSRRAWHFPQTDTGDYVGFHPSTSADAIAHLEYLRAKGGRYFLIPGSAFWWLNHYGEFTLHLQSAYQLVVRQDDTCFIFELLEKRLGNLNGPNSAREEFAQQCRELARSLLPETAVVAVVSDGDERLLELDGRYAMHFPCASDGTHLRRTISDSSAAHVHLALVQEQGAEFLIVPTPALASPRRYRGLAEVLKSEHELVTHQQHVCEIWELTGFDSDQPRPTESTHSDND